MNERASELLRVAGLKKYFPMGGRWFGERACVNVHLGALEARLRRVQGAVAAHHAGVRTGERLSRWLCGRCALILCPMRAG